MKLITEHIIYTLQIPKIGKKTAFKIFKEYDEKVIKSDSDFKSFIFKISSKYDKILGNISDVSLETFILKGKEIISKSEEEGINIISYFDDDYPNNLKIQLDRPIVINYKGDLNLLNTNCLCIIGTRKSTTESNINSFRISEFFGNKGFNIVSGLALGCDTYAHRGALKTLGKTTAVLGSALNKIYPKENSDLIDEIIFNGGLIVSEYFINSKTLPSNFIVRDKLQSMISDCIIVIQSKTSGGSMYAAKHGFNSNKNIAALNNKNDLFSGNLELIEKFSAFPLEPSKVEAFYEYLKKEFYKKTNKQLDLF